MKNEFTFNKEDEIYNEKFKEKFINEKFEEFYAIPVRIFKVSYLMEKSLDKDLCEFNVKEIESVIKSLRYTSVNTVRNAASCIRRYIDWMYAVKYKLNNLNILNVLSEDWYASMVRKSEKTLFTGGMLEEVCEILPDPQTELIIRLTMLGVAGNKLSELRNLKIQDVDFVNNRINLMNEDESVRTMYIDDYILNLIKRTHMSLSYITPEGAIYDKEPSDYVIKPVVKLRRISEEVINSPISQFKIIAMCKEVGVYIGEPHFTMKNIRNSAMLNIYYKALKEKNGENFDLDYPGEMENLKNVELVELLAKPFNWNKHITGRDKRLRYDVSNYTRYLLNFDKLIEVYNH